MDEENTNLKDEVKKLNQNFERLLESGKVKGVKTKKLGRSEKKKGYVRYIFINENREITVKKVPIDEGTTLYEGIPRIATTDYMLNWDGQPTIIQPSWSVRPFSAVENYEQAVKDGLTSAGYKLLMNRIEMGKITTKKKISGIVIFLVIVAMIVAGYLLLKK